jgi:hypothetical protein
MYFSFPVKTVKIITDRTVVIFSNMSFISDAKGHVLFSESEDTELVVLD